VKKTRELAKTANDLGLEVLLELHEEKELSHINEFVDIIGINNRNLKTFTVDLNHSVQLASKLPAGIPKVSESGLSDPRDVAYMRTHGFSGFLIGENFMKTSDPAGSCASFVNQCLTLYQSGQS
jgi:indole-3-glycerol phosphate synthase